MPRRTELVVGSILIAAATSVGPLFADTPTLPRLGAPIGAVDLDPTLGRLSEEVGTIDAEIDRARSAAEKLRGSVRARARAYYRLSRAGLLPFGSGFESLLEQSAKVERLRHGIERDVGMLRDIDERRAGLADRRQKLVDRKARLEVQRNAMAQARAALLEADDRTRAFERAFSDSSGEDYLAVYGASPGISGPVAPQDESVLSRNGLQGMKGRLPFPLAGRAEIRSVTRAGAGGPGVEMKATPGTPVRSVFPGRVAFADEYSIFGRVVIIDHGDHYFTLSGNLGSIEVKVGDEVRGGGRIGTVGTYQNRGVLYFEVRRGAETLDAAPWFGL